MFYFVFKRLYKYTLGQIAFSKTCWDKLTVENETRPLFLTTNGLTMSSKTIKWVEEKVKDTLLDVRLGKEFKDYGSLGNKEIDRWEYFF